MDKVLEQLPEGVAVRPSARMSEYTTFQLGGPCRALIDCPNADLLVAAAQALHAAGIDYLVIGQGSNLLVADAGIDSVVLRYCTDQDAQVRLVGDAVDVSGGTLLDDLARISMARGVGDLSFCSGIPGTVGGAIVGNAGAFGRQIGDWVESLDVLERDGRRHRVAAAEVGFEYRGSRLKTSGGIVLSARLKTAACDRKQMELERERIMELRRSKHPDWRILPCAGSVFRNIEPTSAAERRQAAGWFLEEAGAKALRVGGAHLFEKHANIIIAEAGATAHDVYELTTQMIAAVQSKFKFTLEREIKLIGDF